MEFIFLNSYASYIDAHIAKGVLEEHDIQCWLKDENTVTIDPILTNAVGGIKVMVAKEQAQRAWEILEKIRREHKATIACPTCNSHNVEFVSTPRKASNWLSFLSGLFVTKMALPVDMVNHCFDCGHEFPAEDKPEDAG